MQFWSLGQEEGIPWRRRIVTQYSCLENSKDWGSVRCSPWVPRSPDMTDWLMVSLLLSPQIITLLSLEISLIYGTGCYSSISSNKPQNQISISIQMEATSTHPVLPFLKLGLQLGLNLNIHTRVLSSIAQALTNNHQKLSVKYSILDNWIFSLSLLEWVLQVHTF